MNLDNFKPIPGYERYYLATPEGLIWSVRSKRFLSNGTHTEAGYIQVALTVNNVSKLKYVHRLMALAFFGDPPPGKNFVLHGDGNPSNNRVENLRWGNQSENMSDAVKHGTQRNQNTGKLECDKGHLFSPENTIKKAKGRACRECTNYQRRVKAAESRRNELIEKAIELLSSEGYTVIEQKSESGD